MNPPPDQHTHRKNMRRCEGTPAIRFITFSCYGRLPLLNNPAIMDLFVSRLADAQRRMSFSVYAWVVMPEHAHIIFRPGESGTWAEIASSVKTSVARRVLGRWRKIDAPILSRLRTRGGETHFWQTGGGFDRNIRDTAELLREIRYIHFNPVRRGIVEAPELWRWSSMHWWMGDRNGELSCELPPGNPKAWAAWKGFK